MSFVLSLLALLALTLLFLRERRLYIERHDRVNAQEHVQERAARAQLRVLRTGDVQAAPQRPPLWIVPIDSSPPDDRPAA